MAFYSNSLNFPNLTVKASPTGSDSVLISDAAAGGIPKQALISTLPASASLSVTEVDFGSTPLSEQTFTITDASVSGTSKIIAWMSGLTPTGKDQDELEMDSFWVEANPGTGNFTLYIRGLEGYLADKFKVLYMVG